MNLLEKINFKGEWFLPDRPDDRLVGELLYEPDGITLGVHGRFTELLPFEQEKPYDVIFGIIEGNIRVTLCKVFVIQRGSITFSNSDEFYTPDMVYRVNAFFVGAHYADGINHRFGAIKGHMTNFDEWVAIAGWKFPSIPIDKDRHSFSVEYALPEPINLEIPIANMDATIDFVFKLPSIAIAMKELHMRQTVFLRLESKESKDMYDWLKQIEIFQAFLVLAMGKSSNFDQVELLDENAKKYVSLYYHQTNIFHSRIIGPFDMLFTYSDVRENFSKYINNWYELYEKLDDLLWLLVDQFYHSPRASSDDFLNLAQLTESLHAKLYNHPLEDPKSHRKKLDEILACVPEQHKEYVRRKLEYNGMTLNDRLTELIAMCPSELLSSFVSNSEDFLKSVKDTRNYYTHYGKDNKTRIAIGMELFELSKQLRILLMAIIFREIGLPMGLVMRLKKMNNYI